jgi:pimeloyl-ACP methyl ester carboxylesterase
MAINPVIMVHGIQGAWLKNEYPVDYDKAVLWTGILKKEFDALHLHPMDATVDSRLTRFVMPHQTVPIIYENIVDEIRNEMDDQPYVYVFTYDWRKDNRITAQILAEFINRILHVTGVHERAAGRISPRKVVLIGHSMGGMVIKWCATQIVPAQKIAKIITIATPFRGSLKAVEALLPGARNLFGVENKKSMRHAARTLPGIYQLLPTWPGALADSVSGGPLDPFDVSSWQKNLVDGLARKYSPDFFPKKLTDARAFSKVMGTPWPKKLLPRVYYAYGIESATWRQVKVNRKRDNFYMFSDAVSDDQGDGTVHSLSSIQTEVSGRNRTYIDRKYPVWDFLAGQHANMPNHPELKDWILGLLKINPHAKDAFESPR